MYEVRSRKDKCGADLISDALPFGGLWYAEHNAISNAIGYATFYSRSHAMILRVYDEFGHCDRNARARWGFSEAVNPHAKAHTH